jgi:PhoH-like ATPase
MRKTFVLDTNVLLHNPDALFVFDDNAVVIPFVVLEELDTFKSNNDDLGRNARQAIRHLDGLRQLGSLSDGVAVERTGGTVQIMLNNVGSDLPQLTKDTPDNRIIAVAHNLQKEAKMWGGKDGHGGRVVLVSKDINCRVKADAIGLTAQDFENQKINFDEMYSGWRELAVGRDVIDALYRHDGEPGVAVADLDVDDLNANEFVLLKNELDEHHTAIGRIEAEAGRLVPIKPKRGPVHGIAARNLQQTMALELLMDDRVKFVTLVGSAGTGKTLLALAAGMAKTVDAGEYQRLLVARPIMPMGRDIGYLPGDKDEKLAQWMQPIFDNLALLLNTKLNHGDNKPAARDQVESVEKQTAALLAAGTIVMEPLTYIRGRSIPQQFMIVDEAQNLTPHEVKTIASRVGEGTKLILTGDATQIDNPYLDSSSNGLSYAVERLKNNALVGHITLAKAERSELASLVVESL